MHKLYIASPLLNKENIRRGMRMIQSTPKHLIIDSYIGIENALKKDYITEREHIFLFAITLTTEFPISFN